MLRHDLSLISIKSWNFHNFVKSYQNLSSFGYNGKIQVLETRYLCCMTSYMHGEVQETNELQHSKFGGEMPQSTYSIQCFVIA